MCIHTMCLYMHIYIHVHVYKDRGTYTLVNIYRYVCMDVIINAWILYIYIYTYR